MGSSSSLDCARYQGGELALFAHATNWKRYFRSLLAPYIREDVLEVGAGIGGTTAAFSDLAYRTWTCLEPDQQLTVSIREKVASRVLPAAVRIVHGSIDSLECSPRFDSIIYIDVLEHIEHDRDELQKAAALLRPGGYLVVLSPAHQALYTEFDESIGHFRRYDRASLLSLHPPETRLVTVKYLDSVGALASIANRLLLHRSIPSLQQILFWDKVLVPISRLVDPLSFYKIGKSILAVWEKTATTR